MSPLEAMRAVMASNLPQAERHVLLCWASHIGTGMEAWPSAPTLAKATGMTDRGVRKLLLSLEGRGVLVLAGKTSVGGKRHRLNVEALAAVTAPPKQKRKAPPRNSIPGTPEQGSPRNDIPDPPEQHSGPPGTVFRTPTPEQHSGPPRNSIPGTPEQHSDEEAMKGSCEEASSLSTDRQADPAACLSVRTRKALKAAGLASDTAVHASAVCALTLSELRKRPGIGKKTANEVTAWLAEQGRALRPDAPPSRKATGMAEAVKPYRDAWYAAWKALHAEGESYPLDFHRDNAHLGRVREMSSNLEKVEGAFRAYIRAAKAGTAFPNEPPTIGGFVVKGATWLLKAEPSPRKRSNVVSIQEQIERDVARIKAMPPRRKKRKAP